LVLELWLELGLEVQVSVCVCVYEYVVHSFVCVFSHFTPLALSVYSQMIRIHTHTQKRHTHEQFSRLIFKNTEFHPRLLFLSEW